MNLYTYALNNPTNFIDPFGLDVTINTRAVRGTFGGGAHSSVNITTGNGTDVTYGSYQNESGENEVRINDPSDHGPGRDPVTASTLVPPPPGMSQAEWDAAVIAAGENRFNSPSQSYEIFPDPGQDEGNCHTTTRGILTDAGGGVPPGFDPPGLNPDLHPSPGR
ncbi:MAG TPA: hypothetical protein ENI85_16220 [Deltaproteobacteria bacterium]|nr:hypothetical protein [Deltaproteobacteria bacterium]